MRIRIALIGFIRQLLHRGPYSHPKMIVGEKVALVPIEGASVPDNTRVAVIIHLFHIEMAEQFLKLCVNIPCHCDILITTDTESKAEAAKRAFSKHGSGKVVVRLVQNRGRDMPSKLIAYKSELSDYDIVLFVHSKRTEQFKSVKHAWRDVLLHTLAGSREIASTNIALLLSQPDLGIVFPDHFDQLRKFINWGENRKETSIVGSRIGVDIDRAKGLEFPAGSMFWAKPAALRPLLDLSLSYEDFPEEAGQIDKTLAHVVERLFLFSGEKAGFWWLKVVTQENYRDRGNRLHIAKDGTAYEKVREARLLLTRSDS